MVEPSSLVKRRLGSLSLQNENKLSVSDRLVSENPQEQTSKKPRARMRSALSTKNLNVEN